jgi:hypothetical protein
MRFDRHSTAINWQTLPFAFTAPEVVTGNLFNAAAGLQFSNMTAGPFGKLHLRPHQTMVAASRHRSIIATLNRQPGMLELAERFRRSRFFAAVSCRGSLPRSHYLKLGWAQMR